MSDVYHRMACAYWGKNVGHYRRGNSLTDAEITGWEAAAGVLLDWLGTFHGIPASELAQARRELGLEDRS